MKNLFRLLVLRAGKTSSSLAQASILPLLNLLQFLFLIFYFTQSRSSSVLNRSRQTLSLTQVLQQFLPFNRKTHNILFNRQLSQALAVESTTCQTCMSNVYNPKLSSSFLLFPDEEQIKYGSAVIKGNKAWDDVKISEGLGLDQMSIFLIKEQQGFYSFIDGILGMARKGKIVLKLMSCHVIGKKRITSVELNVYQKKIFYSLSRKSSTQFPEPLIMDMLKNKGQISERVFSVLMLGTEEPGTLEIGGFSIDHARTPLVWLSLNESLYWMTTVDGFRIGNSDPEPTREGMTTRSYSALFDTGTSLTLLPQCNSTQFLQKDSDWNKGKRFIFKGGYYGVPCDKSLYQSLFLRTIDGYLLEIHPDYYILEDLYDPELCALGISIHSEDYFILGNTFMRGYLQVYDMENGGRLGLAPHHKSSVQDIEVLVKSFEPSSFDMFRSQGNWVVGTLMKYAYPIYQLTILGSLNTLTTYAAGMVVLLYYSIFSS